MKLFSPIGAFSEGAKITTRRTSRKRQRPSCSGSSTDCAKSSPMKPLVLLLCAVSLTQTGAFSAVSKSAFRGVSKSSDDTRTGFPVGGENDEFLERLLSKGAAQEEEEHYKTTTSTKRQRDSPWLRRYQEVEDFPLEKLQDLQELLTKSGFSSKDNQEILQTMFFYYTPSPAMSTTSASATSLLLGMIDFVTLIVAEHGHFETMEPTDDAVLDASDDRNKMPIHCDIFASKPVILAGIVHYAECVGARNEGIYDHLEHSLQRSCATLATKSLPPACTPYNSANSLPFADDELRKASMTTVFQDHEMEASPQPCRYPPKMPQASREIAASAATIKRAEILARTIMGVGSTRRLNKAEAEALQGLLLSSMDDWRALSLRCIASLFRLEGILYQQQHKIDGQHGVERNGMAPAVLLPGLRAPEVVHTAQEAIMVYGTLAQRLGMHQLKAKIEEKAFQILYQRQYKAVASVYRQNGSAMQVIRSHLSTQIDALLRSDESLMAHIESLEISSRVKEPFSFWKKLLKTKAKQKRKRKMMLLPADSSTAAEDSRTVPTDLSFGQVQDGIALRVMLKAKKESPDELDEVTRAREKLLCYYVQHLIRKQWPGDEDRVKDYIQNPKPNGYQSLHYTAWLTYFTGQHFPFEVQVRSEEMHRIAEYGVAAHWDYKLASVGSQEQDIPAQPTFLLKAAADAKKDESSKPMSVADAIQDLKEPEVVVDPTSLSLESVMKLSPPAMNGNTPSPRTPTKIIGSEVAAEYDSLLNDRNGKAKAKKDRIEYIDALVTARQSLVQQRVYVFVAGSASLTMEQGQLLILDAGSSIRDALEKMKEETPEILQPLVEETVLNVGGNVSARPEQPPEPSLWQNGQPAKMDDIVRNGDVLLLEL